MPGFKWGESGKCYTYDPDDDAAKKAAKQKAVDQGLAIGGGSLDLETKECAVCERERELSAFAPDRRRKDGRSASCVHCRSFRAADGSLETVELLGVDVLEAGGPYFGQGSPEKGDFFTTEQLEEWAANTNGLIAADELASANKVGHSKKQQLLVNSGLTEGEMPAAGWLENFRVEGDKLLADVKDVPKVLGELIKAKAFKTRSVEMTAVKPQTKAGKKLGKNLTVISALAWLGAKAPAVRTLDEIVALYGSEQRAAMLLLSDEEGPAAVYTLGELEAETVRLVDLAEVVWSPTEGFESIRQNVQNALNELYPGEGEFASHSCWVRDVASGKALVEGYGPEFEAGTAWVVPFTLSDGGVKLAVRDEWTLAQQEWVEAAKQLQAKEPVTTSGDGGDTSGVTTTVTELSEERITALAAAFEIEEEDADKRRDLVLAQMRDLSAEPKTDKEPVVEPPVAAKPETDPVEEARIAALESKADLGVKVYNERKAEKKELFLRELMQDGKIDPAKRETWERAFEKDEEATRDLAADLVPNDEFKRVFGADGDSADAETTEATDDALYRSLAAQTGIDNPATLRKDS